MSQPVFFDAFTEIGPRPNKDPAQPWSLAHLLADLDHCGVAGALVASTMSVAYDAMHENLALATALEKYPRLFPVWNVMPHHTGEFPEPKALEPLLAKHRVAAVSIHPASNAWDWQAPHSRPLLRFLEDRRQLLIFRRSEFADFAKLREFLEQYRQLPVLLVHAKWNEQRFVLPLLDAHRNLHISFDHFQINEGIEDLVARGHADQLVFASNAPQMSVGAHRAFVDYAAVRPAVRAKIAGGNLSRLLGGLTPPPFTPAPPADEIEAAARHGLPLPVPVLDLHMHILHEGLHGAGRAYRMTNGGPAAVFALAKRLGYCGGGFMSWNGVVSADPENGNACTAAALDAAPPGYWGLASFNPWQPAEDLRRQVEAAYADPRFVGMKPYVTFGREYHDPCYAPWFEFGNEHALYGLMHRNRGDMAEIDAIAPKYPRVRWLVAHCGADYATARKVSEACRKHPNVYAEITLTPVTAGIIEFLVENCGEDRVIYGSDLPMRDPRPQLGWVVHSKLSERQKRLVLAGNAMRVLQPCLDRLPPHNRPQMPPS